MRIVMLTNTYRPHVGGVANSVHSFSAALRGNGHEVLIVAPTYDDLPAEEDNVLRIPAIQNFNGSDFSVRLPITALLSGQIDEFEPQIVHSHHPLLLGDTALRVAAWRNLPLVFTHHTMYERYTHYVPGDSPVMRKYVMQMVTEYANLCDWVCAPSESIAQVLRTRGVSTPITALPTGIDTDHFAAADGARFRRRAGIGDDAFVVGHVGRLAQEKNLGFLSRAVCRFLGETSAEFVVVGSGPFEREIRSVFTAAGRTKRLHMVGTLQGAELADAYAAMDVFAFASHTETQGMVLAEAMAAGTPVVALDAPGVREIVHEGENGRLLSGENEGAFADALREFANSSDRAAFRNAARETAEAFSMRVCVQRLIGVYQQVLAGRLSERPAEENAWTQALRFLESEWELWSGRAEAAARTIREAVVD